MKRVVQWVSVVAVCVMCCGCASSMYGKKPVAVPGQQDVYTFSIYKNAYATRAFMDRKSKEVINQIMRENGYKDYRILNVDSGLLINKDTFKVKFYKSELRPVE